MKVNFIVTESFLRTKTKTDPFYDPLIETIGAMPAIEWKVFLWRKGVECGYPLEKVDSFQSLEVCSVWFYRLCRLIVLIAPSWRIYRLFGWLARPFFARKFNADVIVTQAGMFADIFATLLPEARIVDVQHGVVFSRHRGYFDCDGRLLNRYRDLLAREFWVFGQGFADCFFKNSENAKDLQGRVKVIGDVVRAGENVGVDSLNARDEMRNVVVFSLQLTADLSQEEMAGSVERMEAFFTDFFAKYGDKYKCFVKHHPRFNNVYDLSGFYAKFPQVTEIKSPWTELYPRMALHVTFNSTVTFDCASHGIPTFLVDLPSAKILVRDFYKDDYRYPYYDKSVVEILALPTEESRSAILTWYHRFYTPFSEKNCLQLLKGEV